MCILVQASRFFHAGTQFTEPYSLKIPQSPFVGCTILAIISSPLEPRAHSGAAIAVRLSLGSWRNRNAPLSCRRGSKFRYPHAVQTRSDRPREKRCNGPRRDQISPLLSSERGRPFFSAASARCFLSAARPASVIARASAGHAPSVALGWSHFTTYPAPRGLFSFPS